MRTRLVAIVSAAVVTFATAPAVAGGHFVAALELDGFWSPVDIELADVTGDGIIDVLAVSRGNDALTLRAGTPAGGFTAPQHYTVPGTTRPTAVAVADFNEDGHADAVVPFELPFRLQVFLGTPAGLTPGPLLAVSGQPTTVATGDYDGDGHADIFLAGTGKTLWLWRGTGAGTFTGGSGFALPTTLHVAIATAELSGDGKLDLVVATATGRLVKAIGTGTTFINLQTAQLGSSARDLVGADLDGDGFQDAAFTDEVDGAVKVARVDRMTGFGTPAMVAIPSPSGIATADFDGDARADLAVTSRTAHDTTTLIQRGLVLSRLRRHPGAGLEPVAVALGDLDGDGSVDIATANRESHTVSVLLSRPLLTSPSGLSAGARDIGTSGSASLDLVGDGFAPVTIGSPTLSGPHAGDFELSADCAGVTLAYEQTCRVTLRFAPGELGPRAALLTVPSDSEAGPLSISLSGTGIDTLPPATIVYASDGDVYVSHVEELTGRTTDAGSGVGSVHVTYRPLLGENQTAQARLDCAEPRRDCTWSAPLPGLPGPYEVEAFGIDRNGTAESPAGSRFVLVV